MNITYRRDQPTSPLELLLVRLLRRHLPQRGQAFPIDMMQSVDLAITFSA